MLPLSYFDRDTRTIAVEVVLLQLSFEVCDVLLLQYVRLCLR